MAKRRAVSVRRVYVRRRSYSRGRSSSGRKIPLAIVAGMAPGVFSTFANFGEVMNTYGFKGFADRLAYYYAGYNPWQNRWDTGGLKVGLYPVILGVAVHALASKFGINRYIPRMLPVEI